MGVHIKSAILLISLLVLSSCGDKKITFRTNVDLIKESEQTINKLLHSECITHELNDYPYELNYMRTHSFDVSVIVEKPFNHELASEYGGDIYITPEAIPSDTVRISTLMHELAHVAGFEHPNEGDPFYGTEIHANSFPSRMGNAAEKCLTKTETI